jgi:hypothetical protein
MRFGNTEPGGVKMTTITVTTVLSGSAEKALAKVSRYVAKVDGFSVTGRVSENLGHGRYEVEVQNVGGNVNDFWVVMTSYGMSPSKNLGSHWQTVPGVGKAFA